MKKTKTKTRLTYVDFKVMLADLMIFTTLVNLFLTIKNVQDNFGIIAMWGFIFIVSVLFLVYFAKDNSNFS